MGPSGSGKSTLLNILGCFDRPTRGRYRLAGEDVSELGADALAETRNRTLGFVFQSFNLLARTTALENVELPLVYAGVHPRERRERARRRRWSASAWPTGWTTTPASCRAGSSSASRSRARWSTSRALVLADEPTGNLDSRASDEMMALLAALAGDGITIVVVTHEPDVAARAAARDRRARRPDPGGSRRARAPRTRGASEAADAMRPGDIVRVALRALLRNKLRSLLTALGIIIGVAAVIAMVAIGEGARARVEQAFSAMGTNVLIVSSGAKTSGRRQGGRRFVADADLGRSARDPRRRRGRSLRRAARPHDRARSWPRTATGRRS